jgi:flagellar protein FliO/FliZ
MEPTAWPQILRFVCAMVFVLALMGALTVILRLIRDRHPLAPAKKKRLRIVESIAIDSRRRAILLRRDDKEHLVILGHSSETVVESGIESPENSGA